METVMQAIHDYGKGHRSVSSVVPSSIPTETYEVYQAHINDLLVQEDFADLEKIAQQNRVERGSLVGGGWKNNEFFAIIGYPPHAGEMKDSDYELQIARVKRWIDRYPNSAAARISLARIYVSYAFFGRGTGLADTISDSQWRLYSARTGLAIESLLSAADLKERDPFWYDVMQQVAFAEGWDKADARTLLDQALAFEPSYYHYYREYADYLMPQWYGDTNEIVSFAEEVSNRFPGPEGSILYFRIVSSLAIYNQLEVEQLPGASWPKLIKGHHDLLRLYGNSNLDANRFAFMAYIFKDVRYAQEGFASVVTFEPTVWSSEKVFECARDWANPPFYPARQP